MRTALLIWKGIMSHSVTLNGLDGTVVEAQATTTPGLPRTTITGLPDPALAEARDRCRAAFTSTGTPWPTGLTIDLLPADLPKAGSHHDLAIAAAILAATGATPAAPNDMVLLGELGLDGQARPVRGVLPMALTARSRGFRQIVVPTGQGGEALLAGDVTVFEAAHLADLIDLLNGRPRDPRILPVPAATSPAPELAPLPAQVEWAVHVAATGGHNMLITGDTDIAATAAIYLAALLPDLTPAEALEVAALRSLAGLDLGGRIDTRPPLATADPTLALAAIIGGGSRLMRPGLISLAHCGVLHLQDAPEFSPAVLEALRGPLDGGHVSIARAGGATRFPARAQLVVSTRTCPCGHPDCQCGTNMIRRYHARTAIIATRCGVTCDTTGVPAPVPADAATQVARARATTAQRLHGTGWACNADMPGNIARAGVPAEAMAALDKAVERGRLSGREVDHVCRVAWTLADMAGRPKVSGDDVSRALDLQPGWQVAS